MSPEPPVALITGASRGLGRHTALVFARAGYRVSICGRKEHDLAFVAREIVSAGGEARCRALDVRDHHALESWVGDALGTWGRIDVLVNNAGLSSSFRPLVEWTRDQVDETLDVNIKGTVYACQAVLPSMYSRRSGHILNISSDVGRRPVPNMAPYVAAKHAVVGFSGSLYREAREHNVKVTVVLPGIIDTHFGGAKPGDRDMHWTMNTEHVAEALLQIVRQPGNLTFDEVTLHPLGQDF